MLSRPMSTCSSSCSRTGSSARQGRHQGAQKSTTIGPRAIASSKVAPSSSRTGGMVAAFKLCGVLRVVGCLLVLAVLVWPAVAAAPVHADDTSRAAASFAAMEHVFYDRATGDYRERPGAPPGSHAWPYSQALAAQIAIASIPSLARRAAVRARLAQLDRRFRQGATYTAWPSGDVYVDDNEWLAEDLLAWNALTGDPDAEQRAEAIFGAVTDAWDDVPVGRRLHAAQDRRGGLDVGERAQHPRDVAQRAPLPPPLGQRARRLALEVEQHPVARRACSRARHGFRAGRRRLRRRRFQPRSPERLPEVEVAVVADHTAQPADVREQPQALAHLLAAAADWVEVVVVVGQLEEHRLDLVVDARREQPERLARRLLGAEAGVGRVGAEQRVHPARDLAEPPQAREEALRLIVDRVERELPAVDAARDEALQDPERRVHRLPRVRVPAGQLRDVLEAVLGEEAQQLELGVDARLEPAEDLQDQLLVEDDGRIRLLRRDRARLAQLLTGRGRPLHRSELDHTLPRRQLPAAAQQVHELAHVPRIGERDEAVVRQQLVRLVGAGVEADLDDLQLEARLVRAQHRPVDHARVDHVPRLRPEPPLLGDELDQRLLVRHSDSSFRSWNQKNPLGPSVSRYGSSPIRGKRVRPNISSGIIPSQRERSSSTACADRAVLCTHRTTSSSYVRKCAKMRGLSGRSAS